VKNDTPLSNLLISMMEKAGVRTDHFGDNTGRIEI